MFNALAGVLTAVELNLHLLKPYLGDQTYPVLLFGVIVANAVMRVLTTQALRA